MLIDELTRKTCKTYKQSRLLTIGFDVYESFDKFRALMRNVSFQDWHFFKGFLIFESFIFLDETSRDRSKIRYMYKVILYRPRQKFIIAFDIRQGQGEFFYSQF